MKRGWKIGIGVSVAYVAMYLALSVTGGYEPGKSGRFTRGNLNLPTHDILIWQLRFGRDSPFHGYSQVVPLIFSPLLRVDRQVWHRQLPMLRLDESGEIVEGPRPPIDLMHPRMKKVGKIMADYAARMEEVRLTPSMEDDMAVTEEMMKKVDAIYE